MFQLVQGTDSSMLDKLTVHHGENPLYVHMKLDKKKEFGVRHFAGVVMYQTAGEFNFS